MQQCNDATTVLTSVLNVSTECDKLLRVVNKELADGLVLEKIASPLGVLLIIFESRPEALIQAGDCSLQFILCKCGKSQATRRTKSVKDKMNSMENQIAKILEINSFRRAQSPTTDVDDVDGQNGDHGDE